MTPVKFTLTKMLSVIKDKLSKNGFHSVFLGGSSNDKIYVKNKNGSFTISLHFDDNKGWFGLSASLLYSYKDNRYLTACYDFSFDKNEFEKAYQDMADELNKLSNLKLVSPSQNDDLVFLKKYDYFTFNTDFLSEENNVDIVFKNINKKYPSILYKDKIFFIDNKQYDKNDLILILEKIYFDSMKKYEQVQNKVNFIKDKISELNHNYEIIDVFLTESQGLFNINISLDQDLIVLNSNLDEVNFKIYQKSTDVFDYKNDNFEILNKKFIYLDKALSYSYVFDIVPGEYLSLTDNTEVVSDILYHNKLYINKNNEKTNLNLLIDTRSYHDEEIDEFCDSVKKECDIYKKLGFS